MKEGFYFDKTLSEMFGEVNPSKRHKSLPLLVIPGLTRNPVFLGWIPAFAGMTPM